MMGWYHDYLQPNAVTVYYSPTKKIYALLVDCAGDSVFFPVFLEILEKKQNQYHRHQWPAKRDRDLD